MPGAVKPSAVWSTESLAAALPNGQRDQPLSQNKTAQSRPSAAAAAAAAAAAVTCILPTAQSVYVGDEDGRVVCCFTSSFFLPSNCYFFWCSFLAVQADGPCLSFAIRFLKLGIRWFDRLC